jgi:cell division protein FtsB
MPIAVNVRSPRLSLRPFAGPCLSLFVLFYFSYHLVSGNRGLVAWGDLRDRVTVARQTLEELQVRQKALEQQVALLRRDHLDQDMLEERARRVLGYTEPDEYVILLYPEITHPVMLTDLPQVAETLAP